MSSTVVARNNVRVSGKGSRTMLFAHGFGCDQVMWRFVAPAFEADFQVVCFDYVGSGASDAAAYDSARYSSLDGYATDLLEICAELDLRDVIFVGHSVSAMIGALAAIREPSRFSHLLMIGPSPCYVNELPDYRGGFERDDIEGLLDMMDKNYVGWAGALAPAIMQNADQPQHASELEASFCATDPRVAREFARATFFSDNRADVTRVPVPSLIMQCSDDVIAPDSVGAYLAEHLPHSTFRKLAASGHCPHLSHPDETLAVIREYLTTTGLAG